MHVEPKIVCPVPERGKKNVPMCLNGCQTYFKGLLNRFYQGCLTLSKVFIVFLLFCCFSRPPDPGQKPGQKSDQKPGQKSDQKPGHKSGWFVWPFKGVNREVKPFEKGFKGACPHYFVRN